MVLGVLSVVVILWTDVKDGKGGVTAGGADRMTGDGFALLSAALAGAAQVSPSQVFLFSIKYQTIRRSRGLQLVFV